MSIGNLKTDGDKGNNFPWQLKMLLGQQCACDSLKELIENTDTVEPLLQQILAAIQQGTDYEAALVVDANDVTWLEIRIWNGVSFDPPVYFAAGSNTPGTPVAPITYINPNTYLAQIVAYTAALPTIDATLTNVDSILTNLDATVTNIDTNVTNIDANVTNIDVTTTNIDSTLTNVDTNVTTIEGYLAPVTRTHNTVSTSTLGLVPFGSLRGSVMNVGSTAGTWNGISIPAGVTIPWGSTGVTDPYNQIVYDATGTTFIIEYTT